MHPTTAILLGCGLAVDSSAVALAFGLQRRDHRVRDALALALCFGLVHGALTYAGWFAGAQVAEWFRVFDHWIAAAVLVVLGVKSIRESRHESDSARALSALAVLAAAVATSLDGVSVGFGLAVATEPIALVAISAAVATALGSGAGFLAGRVVTVRAKAGAHVVAGLVLIGIAVSILRDGLAAP